MFTCAQLHQFLIIKSESRQRLFQLFSMSTKSLFHLCYCRVCDNYLNGNPCLIPNLRGKAFNFAPLNMMIAVAFIMLRYIPSILALLV